MTPKRTSAAEATGAVAASAAAPALRVVVISMDTHLAGSLDRARGPLARDYPGLTLSLHAASEYAGQPALIERVRADIASADIIVVGMLFMEDHFLPIMDDLRAHRDRCDALICMVSAAEVVKLTRLGQFDMDKPASGPMALLKKLRGNKEKKASGGAEQMKMLRRLPHLLRFIPGTAQDVRAYFLTMQYWLGGSDENMLNLVRHVIDRGAAGPRRVLRGQDQVLVIDGDDRPHSRSVDILRSERESIIVATGLEAGERVCSTPLEAVVEGMSVRVATEEGR